MGHVSSPCSRVSGPWRMAGATGTLGSSRAGNAPPWRKGMLIISEKSNKERAAGWTAGEEENKPSPVHAIAGRGRGEESGAWQTSCVAALLNQLFPSPELQQDTQAYTHIYISTPRSWGDRGQVDTAYCTASFQGAASLLAVHPIFKKNITRYLFA